MTDFPERISISPTYNQKRDDDFYLVDRAAFPGKGMEYIRADIHEAAVAAAYERGIKDAVGAFDETVSKSAFALLDTPEQERGE